MAKTFSVRLVRPVFQSVTLVVDARNKNEAVDKALGELDAIAAESWRTPPFDAEAYDVHVQSVLDHQRVHESSADPRRRIARFGDQTGRDEQVKYLLLAADAKENVAKLLLQPWFAELPGPAQADLCEAWARSIEYIMENDGLDRDEADSPAAPGGNVVPFPSARVEAEDAWESDVSPLPSSG